VQFIFIGCVETQIENDIRVLVNGRVVNQDNSPIADAHIEVYTDANAFNADRIKVGEGFSEANGNFSVTSLFGANDLFYVLVSSGDAYATYRYQTTTETYVPDDLVFDIETVELAQLAVFKYTITRESGEDAILDYSFRFIEPSCTEVFNEATLDVENSQCYEVRQISRQLNNSFPNIEDSQFIVPLQSQIEFVYSINNTESISQIIDVNTLEYEFQFNY
jgi:hypothetical protein